MVAIPKPASTVILMDDLRRVYLTKRPITMKFLGGFYVFPGGAVDETDYFLLNEMVAREEKFPIVHYVAAARELFEEVGILLANRKDGSPYIMEEKKLNKYRNLLVNKKISFLQMLKDEGLEFNIDSLTYFNHFITPKVSPIRFDTRFFIAKLPNNQTPKPDKKEIEDAFWILPEEALEAYKKQHLPMVFPTILSLQTLTENKHEK